MLLEDEQKVLRLLSMYGSLHIEQIRRFLHDKPDWIFERIIQKLKREGYLHDAQDGYLAADRFAKPDMRIISAVWVLLQFIADINSLDHYASSYPAQLFFLKRNSGYEIIVLYEGEEHLLRLLHPQEDTKYIIVLPDIEMSSRLHLPEAQCLIAVISYDEVGCNAEFYSEGAEDDG